MPMPNENISPTFYFLTKIFGFKNGKYIHRIQKIQLYIFMHRGYLNDSSKLILFPQIPLHHKHHDRNHTFLSPLNLNMFLTILLASFSEIDLAVKRSPISKVGISHFIFWGFKTDQFPL